jgi:hypothetical protein
MVNSPHQVLSVPSIRLTPVKCAEQKEVSVLVSQLIAYGQEQGFTRVRLTGGKTIDVQETTDRIDGLVRSAWTGR